MGELIIGGEAFNVLVEGDENAPVLMLSNSLGTNMHMWDKQMPALTRHFRVVRYDSRGHGGSQVTKGPYSIAQLGRDAVAIMDALGLEKVNWLGLSMGGMVGQWLLTHVPERIGRAVLANTAAQMGSSDFWDERIRTVQEHGMAALAPQVVERWFTRSFREAHRHDVEPILAELETTSPEGYAACCAAIRDMDQLAEIRAVTAPVLVIAGRHDPATPPGMGALIASAIPGAKLVTLDTAHLSNIEAPEAFNRAVLDFLTAEGSDHVLARPQAAAPRHVETHAVAPHHAEEMHGGEAAAEAPKKPRRKPAPHKPAAPAASEPAPIMEAGPEEMPHEGVQKVRKPARPRTLAPAAASPAPRRRPVKKAPAKRSGATAARGGVTKKAAAKKAPAKKTAARKAATKKSAARPAARKSATKARVAKKTAPRKSAVRKAVTKKTVARRTPAKKLAAKKLAVKKTATKKIATKKTVGKKVAAKRTVAKKPQRRPVAGRRPAPTRRGSPRKR